MSGSVLVTGGTGALGRGVVAELLGSGARVTATWRAPQERDSMAEAFAGTDELTLVEADLSDAAGAAGAVAEADSGDGISGLVCLAGGFAAGGRVHEAPDGEFERMIELNLMTAQRTVRAALPAMAERGGGIVLVGARAALEPFGGAAGYIAAKAGVIALARSIAAEYRSEGIRANAILPSLIDTPANREAMPDADHDSWVGTDEIAKVVHFLLSAESAPTSGAAIPVYGDA